MPSPRRFPSCLLGPLLTLALLAGCTAAPPPPVPGTPPAISEPPAAPSSAPAPPQPTLPLGDPAPAHRETRAILPGTPLETTLTILTAEADGPTLFVVGGVHGDEVAGWTAANQLAADYNPRAGTLYILSPANRPGAEQNTRYVTGSQDLNRAFPGDPDGDEAARLAAAIYAEVEAASPALLLDLHEARIKQPGRDFLGSSIIFSSLEGIEGLVFDLLEATRTGALASEPFGYFSPGVDGSINRAVTERLLIPTITVETYRDYPLERRVADQLALARFVFDYYGME